MYFDKFDICEAYYMFAYHYHQSGDTSDKIFYRLHRLGFEAGPLLGSENFPLTDNAQAIYDNLVACHPDAQTEEVFDINNW